MCWRYSESEEMTNKAGSKSVFLVIISGLLILINYPYIVYYDRIK